jgi:hypothetical protein
MTEHIQVLDGDGNPQHWYLADSRRIDQGDPTAYAWAFLEPVDEKALQGHETLNVCGPLTYEELLEIYDEDGDWPDSATSRMLAFSAAPEEFPGTPEQRLLLAKRLMQQLFELVPPASPEA